MPSPNGMTEASGNTHGSADADSKQPEVKEKLPVKRSKGGLGSSNMITRKSNEEAKTTGISANGTCSKSAESGSDSSSDGSDANSQNDSPMKSEGRQKATEADSSQNGNSTHVAQNVVVNPPHGMVNHAMALVPMTTPGTLSTVSGPATNLNIRMDYWGSPAASPIPAMRGQVASSVAGAMVLAGSQDWLQDERELKRQRRKQSNRELARRSRLRKQAECDELAQRTEALKEENASLRLELNRIRGDYEKLLTENATLNVICELFFGDLLNIFGNFDFLRRCCHI